MLAQDLALAAAATRAQPPPAEAGPAGPDPLHLIYRKICCVVVFIFGVIVAIRTIFRHLKSYRSRSHEISNCR